MKLTSRDYAIATFTEAAVNQLDHRIMWACISAAGKHTNCKALDANVQAAIQAGEWLKSITT